MAKMAHRHLHTGMKKDLKHWQKSLNYWNSQLIKA